MGANFPSGNCPDVNHSGDNFPGGSFPSTHQLSTYATGGDGGHPKCVQLRTGGGDVTPPVYLRTFTISFSVFGSIFVF